MTKKSSEQKVRVHFDPDDLDIVVERGDNLLEAAIAAGVHINASCGGAGVCGTCKVLIAQGEVESTRTEKISEQEYEQGLRQACQSRVTTDLVVYIPVESRLETAVLDRERVGGIQPSAALAANWRFNPPLGKLFVELSAPTLEDNVSDLSRLLRGLKQQCDLDDVSVDFNLVKKLANVLRDGDWKVTVTVLLTGVNDRRRQTLINVEPGDTRKRHFSLAFDIGTTGVRGQLLDLNRGKVRAGALDYNGQISYGEDVISRIAYSQRSGGLKKLQKTIVATINGMIGRLLAESKVEMAEIGHIVVAANTTMVQLFLGLESKYIRLDPYTPTVSAVPLVKACSLGLEVADHVYVYILPSVASYVGADIVSGVVGTGMYQREKLTLYIDIGTNGEIVIGNSSWMVTASCSAGPAFEGGGIKHGMIAMDGAIEDFDIHPSSFEPVIGTIGEVKPKGICGSGLINTVAGLLEAGVIGQNGKFNTDLQTKRIREGGDGYEYVLAWAAETQTGKDIVITEVDIDNLIRAKAAMYAGCQTLVKSVGLSCSDLEQVIIAGAFGSHIDIEKSIIIGLFPDIPRDRFIFIGNGSLLGARLTSFSTDILAKGEMVAKMMTNFELSVNVDFMNNYTASLFLPHPNADEFPSVYKRLRKLKKVVRGRG
ncbi:MAG TPA: ASKHA domain-containing protein [Dehalococcoidales bacterium]|nr:ASKHA domain-containing protein [Dehalococcoidales bacterium]